jgi:hypothetical protein
MRISSIKLTALLLSLAGPAAAQMTVDVAKNYLPAVFV